MGGVVMGRQRLGVNLVSLIAVLREEGRLPWRTIQWYLKTAHQLELSGGGNYGSGAPGGPKSPTDGDGDTRPNPGQPGGSRRRDGLAGGRGQTATSGLSAPPPNGTSCAGVGIRKWWTRSWAIPSTGSWSATSTPPTTITPGLKQRCWAHLLRDNPRPEDELPRRPGTGPVGGGSPPNLPCRPSLRASPGPATPSGPTTVGTETAGPLPPLPQ